VTRSNKHALWIVPLVFGIMLGATVVMENNLADALLGSFMFSLGIISGWGFCSSLGRES
jgi:hypothetical protein